MPGRVTPTSNLLGKRICLIRWAQSWAAGESDLDGYNWGAGEVHLTARDAAKFGRLYLHDGEFEGKQVVSADWVHDSLQTYSEDAYQNISGFREIGYGYQWWSANVGDYAVNLPGDMEDS